MKDQMIAIRSYEFEDGILHLELAAACEMSTEEVEELHGWPGQLLAVRDGQMTVKQFFTLPDFRDM